MRKSLFRSVVSAVLLAVLGIGLLNSAALAEEKSANHGKPGILIITHGSPSPRWQETVKKLEQDVSSLNEKEKTFHAVAAVNMEFAKPDTADGVEKLEKAGCDRIVVVPAFICPTSHTHFDLPAALGIYMSPGVKEAMKRENTRPAALHVPIVLTPTIGQGNLLEKYVREEINAISVNPEEEAVVLISHGDDDHAGLVDRIMENLLKIALDTKHFTDGEYVYCEVGQSYNRNVVPIIQEFSEKKKRVLVIGFYLVSSAKSISQMGSRMSGRGRNRDSETEAKQPEIKPVEGFEIVFSEHGVAEYPELPGWILQAATEALPEQEQK